MKNLEAMAKELGWTLEKSLPSINGLSIDSRKIQSGDLFVAIKGERFDGHNFISEAKIKGAAALLVEKPDPTESLPQLIVPNSIEALIKLAVLHRQSLSCPIIALTGSNGKTTVKEMIAAILPKPSHSTPGNFNNHIGVPLSILQLTSLHRYAVFELGASHSGEIARTVAIVKPDVALINNIAPAHIEGFGSIDGVAKAKGEIYQGLSAKGTAVVNADDDYANFWDSEIENKKVLRFSLSKPVDVYAKSISYSSSGCALFTLCLPTAEITIELKIPGRHSIANALAAAACCYAANIDVSDIAKGLNDFKGVPGRLTHLGGKNQALIIDDTYNANLRSVLTAIEVLASHQGQKILVFGDMGELGAWSREHHEKIGYEAKKKGINKMFTCGAHSFFASQTFGAGANHYETQDKLAQDLLPFLNKDTTVLVKGSRSAGMEKIVYQLVG